MFMSVLVIILIGLLFSITIHEAVHAFTSHYLGDDTAYQSGRLTLNPLAHIDPFATILLPLMLVQLGLPPFAAAKPVPFNPARVRFGEFGAALVGVSGPLSNLLIAIILGLWGRWLIGFDTGSVSDVLEILVRLNLALFVFNMIPYPPLDGSRLLYAVAPDGLRRLMAAVEGVGLLGLAVFILVFFPLFSATVVNLVNWLFAAITGIS